MASPDLQNARAPDRLDSWKEIAVYLRRGERTVRRWEETEGLPVHRHSHQKQATVYAFRSELDVWLERRGDHGNRSDEPAAALPVVGRQRRTGLWIACLAAGVAAIATSVWFFRASSLRPERSVTVTPLTSFPGSERYPSLSPDGTQVAFSWARQEGGDYDIYTLPIGSHNPRRLTEATADDIGPAWSPDGRWIAFLRTAQGAADVVIVPAAGGPERTVARVNPPNVSGPQYGGWLTWSPDGQWLAVPDMLAPPEPRGLFLLSPRSGGKRRLTSIGLGDFAPAFSPDGRSLAFVRSNAFTASDVFVLPLSEEYQAAGPPRQITFDGKFTTSPAWSGDGRSILFSSGEMWCARKVYQVRTFIPGGGIPGGDRERAEPLPIDLDEASVFALNSGRSGNGGRLVYGKPQFDPNIWLMELTADGKPGIARTLISSTRADHSPQFSPDGQWIAFASSRTGHQEIWLASRDGAELKQLTAFADKPAGTPRWSPDGRWIAFDSTQGGPGIFVMDAAGGALRRVTVRGRIPSWSRDGLSIYYAGRQVMKVAGTPPFTAKEQAPKPFTANGGSAAFESADGKTLYYYKPEGGSIWQMPAAGGAERIVLKGVHDWSTWAVTDRGIYFVSYATPGARNSLQFYRFSTAETRRIAEIGKPAFIGLSVSPDGRSILYTQVDRDESDLMLVENFR